MTKFEDILKKAADNYSLSHDEKARMSHVIREYMAHKPLPRAEVYSISVSYRWLTFAHRPIAAALVLVLIFGSSVTYAAESALPGDALYTIKTYVNEPTRVALATSAEAKANVQIELAERRIEEATVLASEGRLDDKTQDDLAVAFESHAAAAATSIADSGADDDSAPVELASRFENRLAAHENVLAEIEVGTDPSEDTGHSNRLTDAIRSAAIALAETRIETPEVALAVDATPIDVNVGTDVAADIAPMAMAVATETTVAPEATTELASTRSAKVAAAPAQSPLPTVDAKTIARIKSAAERSLKNAQKLLKSAKSLSAEARAKADADLTVASERITDGDDFLATDNDAEAYTAFNDSLRISEQASVYIKAGPSLEKARTRNATSTRGSSRTQIRATVTAPAANVQATVTIPVLPITQPKNDDSENHDANDNSGTDDENNDTNDDSGGKRDDSNDSSFNLFNKLNISL